MKRLNIFFGTLTLGLLVFTTSCDKSYLAVDPKGQTLEVNYARLRLRKAGPERGSIVLERSIVR